MKELSIFIDESGDFGAYSPHSPYYIISMVFHDQSHNIDPAVTKLNRELRYLNLGDTCIHTGPIIRQEEIYSEKTLSERRSIPFLNQKIYSLVIEGISKRTIIKS